MVALRTNSSRFRASFRLLRLKVLELVPGFSGLDERLISKSVLSLR